MRNVITHSLISTCHRRSIVITNVLRVCPPRTTILDYGHSLSLSADTVARWTLWSGGDMERTKCEREGRGIY